MATHIVKPKMRETANNYEVSLRIHRTGIDGKNKKGQHLAHRRGVGILLERPPSL